MSSPEGYILRFLWKTHKGMFDPTDESGNPKKDYFHRHTYCDNNGPSLDRLKQVLISRNTLTDDEFETTRKKLIEDGFISGNRLTSIGRKKFKEDYCAYLDHLSSSTPETEKASVQEIKASILKEN